jgi:hypothetical protein
MRFGKRLERLEVLSGCKAERARVKRRGRTSREMLTQRTIEQDSKARQIQRTSSVSRI